MTAAAYRELVPPGDAAWSSYLDELADVAGRARRSLVLVAVDGITPLGTATLELDGLPEGEAHVRMLGVHPDHRRRGAGRALVAGCIDAAREAGKSVLNLHTLESMTAARALYESIGFRRRTESDIEGMRLLTYELAL